MWSAGRSRISAYPRCRNVRTGTTSTGPDSLTVPDVTGFDKDAARAELEKQGFVVSGFQEENTPDQEKNKVTKTDPAARAVVAKGSKIRAAYVPDTELGTRWFADKAVWVRDGQNYLPFGTPAGAQRYIAGHPGTASVDYQQALAGAV